MEKVFEYGDNLFKLNNNYICVSNEDVKIKDFGLINLQEGTVFGEVVYDYITKIWGIITSDHHSYPFTSREYIKKIIFSSKFIHESIPVLDIEYEMKI